MFQHCFENNLYMMVKFLSLRFLQPYWKKNLILKNLNLNFT